MLQAIAVNALVIVYSAYKRLLNPSGLVSAAVLGVITYESDRALFAALLSFFIAGSAATRLGHHLKAAYDPRYCRTGARNCKQVLATGLVPCLLSLAGQTPAALAFLAAACGDTLSSEMGPLIATSPPRWILKPSLSVPIGVNGGFTAEGLGAAFTGGMVVGATYQLAALGSDSSYKSLVWSVLSMGCLGTLGSLLDSVLGALFQRSRAYAVPDSTIPVVVEGDARGMSQRCIFDRGRNVLTGEMVNALSCLIVSAVVISDPFGVFGNKKYNRVRG